MVKEKEPEPEKIPASVPVIEKKSTKYNTTDGKPPRYVGGSLIPVNAKNKDE